jgi:tetratricopeptide (TPR) repeat protein
VTVTADIAPGRTASPADDPATLSAIRRHEERLGRDSSSLAFAPLADLYRKVGRTADAIRLCREGLARYPHYTTARLVLAKALAAEDATDAALAELGAILEANPGDAQCHRLAAQLLRQRGAIDAALTHLEAAVALDPADRESRSLVALLRADPAAANEATGLARVLADDTFITLPFAAVCLEQGLADEAAHVFTRILRKDPNSREAREGLEQALRARSRRKG